VRLECTVPYSVRPSSLTPHFRPITTTTTLDWELRLAACICISPTDSKTWTSLTSRPSFCHLPSALLSSFLHFYLHFYLHPPPTPAPPATNLPIPSAPPFSLIDLICLERHEPWMSRSRGRSRSLYVRDQFIYQATITTVSSSLRTRYDIRTITDTDTDNDASTTPWPSPGVIPRRNAPFSYTISIQQHQRSCIGIPTSSRL
jgi:hypothetical protein